MFTHRCALRGHLAPLALSALALAACRDEPTDSSMAPPATEAPVAFSAAAPGTARLIGDFDGEGHSDVALWDGTHVRGLLDRNTDGRIDGITPALGLSTDVPFMGDWDGDGVETLALYRKSTNQVIYCNSNKTGAFSVRSVTAVGAGGGIPMRGDWDGNGTDGFAIYDVSSFTFRFYQDMTAASFASDSYGNPGDLPVSGDWNNDGKDGYGIYRPSTRQFWLTNVIGTPATISTQDIGNPGDLPVAGKWHGRTNWSVGVFRPSTLQFFLFDDLSLTNFQAVTWLDPQSVISTSGRQVFYTSGAPHTNSTGVFRTSYSSSASFLPLGIFAVGASVTENGSNMFQQLQSSGFNLAMLWPTMTIAEALTAVGTTTVKLIPRIEYFNASQDANSKVFAWYMWDEPQGTVNRDSLQLRYNTYLSQAVRPLFHTNLPPSTTGPLCGISNNSDPQWATIAAMGEAASLDCYPVHEPAIQHGTFESIANAITTLRTLAPTNRPVWFTPQAWATNESGGERWDMPTPLEYRASVYTAFVHGATGLISFARDGFVSRSGGVLGISPAPADNYPGCVHGGTTCLVPSAAKKAASQALWNSMAGMNSELNTMKPVLLSPSKPDAYTVDLLGPPNSGTSPIRTLLKTSPSGTYLIAVNIINDNLEAVIQLSTAVTSAVVQFENRTVATPLSAIRDTFGPFAVHIYKF